MNGTFNDRRITVAEDKKREEYPHLKEIAARIQKLSYREMMRFSDLLQKHEKIAFIAGTPEALLAVANEILTN